MVEAIISVPARGRGLVRVMDVEVALEDSVGVTVDGEVAGGVDLHEVVPLTGVEAMIVTRIGGIGNLPAPAKIAM